MIDIHSHLLPAVDDGSRTLEQTLRVLNLFVEQGVTEVVLTPHLKASHAHKAPVARFREKFADVVAAAPAGIRLHLGWEIMLDQPGADLSVDGLSLGESNAVLVEFSRHGLPPNHLDEIFRIRMSGRVPVVAHPERYPGVTPEIVEAWKRSGAVIQLDAAAPLMRGEQRDVAIGLLERGLADLFAADNHGDARSLRGVREWLEEQGLEHEATLLTAENPALVLAGRATMRVAPFVVHQGLLDRLKSLILRRPR